MLIKVLGLLFLWFSIIFTTMQQDDVLWIISALCSIALMHFISKWLKIGGLSRLGLQLKKGWFRYLLFGCLIGIGYQLIRYIVMSSIGVITFHEILTDIKSLLVSTLILMISTAYIGFSEEIVFRGYVVNMLDSAFSNKYIVLISATFFTLAHLIDGNLDVFRIAFLFFAGLFFAICFIVTRSLWFVVGIHWFWDFSWFYLGADGSSSSSKIVDVTINQEMLFHYGLIDVVMAFGLFILVFFIWRSMLSKKEKSPDNNLEDLANQKNEEIDF